MCDFVIGINSVLRDAYKLIPINFGFNFALRKSNFKALAKYLSVIEYGLDNNLIFLSFNGYICFGDVVE